MKVAAVEAIMNSMCYNTSVPRRTGVQHYNTILQQKKVAKVEKVNKIKEPTLRERTFADKSGLPFVPDPVVQRPDTHAAMGLQVKAKRMEHQRELRDVQNISTSLGF